MGGFILSCPLCCDKTFTSRQYLIEHLTNILENLCCPHCNNKSSSVVHLIEHLSLDNCQPDESTSQTIIFDENSHNVENIVIQNSDIKVYQNDNIIDNISETHLSPIQYEVRGETSGVNSMYVELLSKNPCLQSQELRLVKENGEGRYMILTQDDAELNTIVTKQNNDGTISLRTVKDMKRESCELTATENEAEDAQIYSCNTCKVSFTSVIEHIRNYHNDEDVVVEEPADEGADVMSVQYDTLQSEEPLNSDRQPPRRVITDTGDIVEEPLFVKIENLPQESNTDQAKEVVNDKSGRGSARRFVQIDKLCDSVVRDITQQEKNGPLHKVMVKEIEGQNGNIVKLYQCMWCEVSVSNLDEFKTRLCTTLKYSCPHCPVTYDNSKSLCAHMKVHKPKPGNESSLSYECGVCCTVFPSNKSLKLHKRMHDPVKARPIDPPVENTDGTEVSVGRYRCTVCYKLIPNDYRAIHQNSHDSSEKMDCSICNKKFSSMEYLEMHMNVHTLDKVTVNKQDKSLPYKCLYCNRRFARPHEKVKHERIHTGEKPHSCEICGKSFRVSYCLTLHMRTHTGARPYACTHCGKRFKAHSVYNHHLLTHSDVRAYKCPYCPKAFKTSVQLAGHKNSHTKPFSCQQCNRPFASLYAVRVHTETHAQHINNLKFSCTVCGASYARAFALKDHVKQHHKQDAETAEGMANQEEVWIDRDNAETIEAEETEAVQSIETEEIDDDLNKELQEEETHHVYSDTGNEDESGVYFGFNG